MTTVVMWPHLLNCGDQSKAGDRSSFSYGREILVARKMYRHQIPSNISIVVMWPRPLNCDDQSEASGTYVYYTETRHWLPGGRGVYVKWKCRIRGNDKKVISHLLIFLLSCFRVQGDRVQTERQAGQSLGSRSGEERTIKTKNNIP